MGIYLSPGNDLFYSTVTYSAIYVDKTMLISFTNKCLFGENKETVSYTHLVFASNSCRLMPLKMIRFPFRHMIPFFNSNRRNPTLVLLTSISFPSSSVRITVNVQRFGISALQGLLFSIVQFTDSFSLDSAMTVPSVSYTHLITLNCPIICIGKQGKVLFLKLHF